MKEDRVIKKRVEYVFSLDTSKISDINSSVVR